MEEKNIKQSNIAKIIMSSINNIKTVVVYNAGTGARYFDVIDTRTGQSVPNVAKPDDFLLDNMTINVRSGTARNSDANLDFGLIVVGNRGMNDF